MAKTSKATSPSKAQEKPPRGTDAGGSGPQAAPRDPKLPRGADAGKIADILAESLAKKFGKGSVFRLQGKSDQPSHVEDVLSTGLVNLDLNLCRLADGRAGMPIRRRIEIVGENQATKTTFLIELAIQAVLRNCVVHYFETEMTLEEDYFWKLAEKTKVSDLKSVILSFPETIEEMYDAVWNDIQKLGPINEKLRKEGLPTVPLVVLNDSLANMKTAGMVKHGGGTIGDLARAIADKERMTTGDIARHDILLVFTNHIKHKIGSFHSGLVGGITSVGGESPKHNAAIRLLFLPSSSIKRGEGEAAQVVGRRIKVLTIKNKCGVPPFRSATLSYYTNYGFSRDESLMEAAVEAGFAERKVGGYEYKKANGRKTTIPRGYDLIGAFDENEETKVLREEIRTRCLQKTT